MNLPKGNQDSGTAVTEGALLATPRRHGPGRRWLTVALYAIAMAWVEAAVVYDLRTLVGRLEPYQPDPLPMRGGLGPVELVRELATLVMLLTVGSLAGRTWRSRLGYAVLAFGVWDMFYYLFLKVICGWPHSLLDWDILFLLPLPWWGPVLAPMLIAGLMIVWGTLAGREDAELVRPPGRTGEPSPGPRSWRWLPWTLSFLGMLLALDLFMADSLRVAGQGSEVIRHVLPKHFNWSGFGVALLLMAAPLPGTFRPRRKGRGARPPAGPTAPAATNPQAEQGPAAKLNPHSL